MHTLGRLILRFWAVILLVLVGVSVCVVNVAENPPQFSPYDEWVYYDYLTKVPTQLFVRQGESIGEPALEAMACTGDGYGPRGEPCTGPKGEYDEPNLYPQQGKTSADPYTPAYFAVTWGLAKVIQFVSGISFLTAARATGAIWLAAGLIALYALFREFRLRKELALGLGLAFIATTHYAFTYVSTDAPTLVAGASIALLGARFIRTGKGLLWLPIASAIATWFKVTNLLPVGMVALTFTIIAVASRFKNNHERWPAPSPSWGRLTITAAAMAVSGVVAEVLWLLIRAATKVGPSPDQGISTDLSPKGLTAGLFVFFFPRDGVSALSPWPVLALTFFTVLTMVGIFGWFISEKGWTTNRAWSIGVVVSATLFAPLLTVAFQILLGTAAPVSPRYAAGLVPLFLVATGILVRNKLSTFLILIYGSGVALAALVGLIR